MRSAKAKTQDLAGRTQEIAFKLACPPPPACPAAPAPLPNPEEEFYFNEEEGLYNGAVYKDGARLFFRLAGKKSSRGTWPHKWVMLAHGFSSSSRAWVPLMLYLASKGWNSFAMDLRGHGDSTKEVSDPTKYTVKSMADDFHFAIHKLELVRRPYAFLGHSAGGILAQEYVLTWPDEISHLLLSSTTPKLISDSTWAYGISEKARQGFLNIDKDPQGYAIASSIAIFTERCDDEDMLKLKENMAKIAMQANPQALSLIFTMNSIVDYRRMLGSIKAPTCILFGDKDVLFDPEIAFIYYDSIPDSFIQLFKGKNHAPHITDTQRFNDTVIDFVTGGLDECSISTFFL